jgi:hypothetical protein
MFYSRELKDEWWAGKDNNGSSHDLFEVLSQHLPGKAEKNQEISQNNLSLSRDWDLKPLKYNTGMLIAQLQYLVQKHRAHEDAITKVNTKWGTTWNWRVLNAESISLCSFYISGNSIVKEQDRPYCCVGKSVC